MPNLSIKNVPNEIVASLRARAAANHRSLQGELLALVSQYVAAAPGTAASASTVLPDTNIGASKGHKSIEQIAAEHRKIFRHPTDKGPGSTVLIRQDRDAR